MHAYTLTPAAALPYQWAQTIRDVSVTFRVGGDARARDFSVKLLRNSVSVKRLRPEPETLLEVRVPTSACVCVQTARKN